MSGNHPRRRAGAWLVALALACAVAPPGAPGAATRERVRIDGGRYTPLYREPVRATPRNAPAAAISPDSIVRRVVAVDVRPFLLDRRPVTNADFLEFVRAHPEWRRSRVSRLFADESYLRHWQQDLDPGVRAPAASPVVYVSWFAARAYAAAQGGRLPEVAEWELVAAADETRKDATRDPKFLARLREIYARPATPILPAVGGPANAWGVQDMHGLVWEWTLDFNSALVTGESRADASLDRSLYCGAGASGAADFGDYAAFMRFAYRASLEADYTTAQLGFRCAYDLQPVASSVPATPRTAEPSLFELDFPLVDANGRERHLREFRGHPIVASMIYTSCTSVCPRVTADLKALERSLPADVRARTRFLLFSLDPARDTPAALAKFAREHALDASRWTLLAAREADMRTLAAVLGVRFKPAGAEIAHTAQVVVVDGSGVIRHRRAGLSSDTAELAEALRSAR